jgi:hypothetical protein
MSINSYLMRKIIFGLVILFGCNAVFGQLQVKEISLGFPSWNKFHSLEFTFLL